MSNFKNGDNTGKAKPSSDGGSEKARPNSVNAGTCNGTESEFRTGMASGSAKAQSSGVGKSYPKGSRYN